MSMKLSRRDKIIFLILIVVAVFIAGGLLLIKPKYEDMQAAQARLAAKEQEKQQLEDKIATLPGLKEQLKNDVDEVDKVQQTFLNEREFNEAHKISIWVKDLLLSENPEMNITSVEITDSTATALGEYTQYETNANYDMKFNADIAHQMGDEEYWMHESNYPAEAPTTTVGGTVVTIGYNCAPEDWETVYNVINTIRDSDKNIYLDTCEADFAGSGETTTTTNENGETVEEARIEGSLVITVYEVYHMDPDDVDKVDT